MAILTVEQGSAQYRVVKVKAKAVLGPGGVVLTRGQIVRVPANDAHTLVAGQQADFHKDEDKVAK